MRVEQKVSTNYHKICVNVKATLFSLRSVVDQFQFKFIETFLFLFVVVSPCGIANGERGDYREGQVGVS